MSEIDKAKKPEFLDVDESDLSTSTIILNKRLQKLLDRKDSEPKITYEDQNSNDQAQLDLFIADLLDYSFKDDTSTMEAPLFSLSTKPDLEEWKWISADGKKWLEVTPSAKGRATIHDKDLLIYLGSQLMAAMNVATRTGTKLPGRRIRFTPHDFFVATERDTGGKSYINIEKTIDRLEGTRLKTNIQNGNIDHRNSFGLIESSSYIIETDSDGVQRTVSVEITLSKWLYNALERKSILTISPRYFQLRKPLEKRLYELARRHVGDQAIWEIEETNLISKAGSRAESKEFRRMMKLIIQEDNIPEYRITLEKKIGKAIYKFYQKDPKKLALALNKQLSPQPKKSPYKPRYSADDKKSETNAQNELPLQ